MELNFCKTTDAATLIFDCETRTLNKGGRRKTETAGMERKRVMSTKLQNRCINWAVQWLVFKTGGCQLPSLQLRFKHTYSVKKRS